MPLSVEVSVLLIGYSVTDQNMVRVDATAITESEEMTLGDAELGPRRDDLKRSELRIAGESLGRSLQAEKLRIPKMPGTETMSSPPFTPGYPTTVPITISILFVARHRWNRMRLVGGDPVIIEAASVRS